MKVYQLTPAFFNQLRQRLVMILVPLFIVIIGFVVWRNAQTGANWSQVLIYSVVGVFILVFVLFVTIPQQTKSWASYRLTLDQDSILRAKTGMPEIKIYRHEIAKISEHPSTGLTIHQKGKPLSLVIPALIQDYPEIRARLEQWHPIEDVPNQNVTRNFGLLILAILLPLAGFYILGTATNPFVIMGVGLALIVTLIGSLVLTQRNPSMDKRTKRNMWIIVIPVFFIGWRVFEQIPNMFSNR